MKSSANPNEYYRRRRDPYWKNDSDYDWIYSPLSSSLASFPYMRSANLELSSDWRNNFRENRPSIVDIRWLILLPFRLASTAYIGCRALDLGLFKRSRAGLKSMKWRLIRTEKISNLGVRYNKSLGYSNPHIPRPYMPTHRSYVPRSYMPLHP